MKVKGKIKGISAPMQENYRDGSVHQSIYVQIQVGVKQQQVFDRYTGQPVTENIADMIGQRFSDQKMQDFMAAGWQVEDVVEVDFRHGVRNNFCYVVIDDIKLVKKAEPQAPAQQAPAPQAQATAPAPQAAQNIPGCNDLPF